MFFDSRRNTRAPSPSALPRLVGARARRDAALQGDFPPHMSPENQLNCIRGIRAANSARLFILQHLVVSSHSIHHMNRSVLLLPYVPCFWRRRTWPPRRAPWRCAPAYRPRAHKPGRPDSVPSVHPPVSTVYVGGRAPMPKDGLPQGRPSFCIAVLPLT